MTACESSGYTGASFSNTTVFQIRHIIIIYAVFWSLSSFIINNILFLAKIISSPRQQMLVLLLFFRRV